MIKYISIVLLLSLAASIHANNAVSQAGGDKVNMLQVKASGPKRMDGEELLDLLLPDGADSTSKCNCDFEKIYDFITENTPLLAGLATIESLENLKVIALAGLIAVLLDVVAGFLRTGLVLVRFLQDYASGLEECDLNSWAAVLFPELITEALAVDGEAGITGIIELVCIGLLNFITISAVEAQSIVYMSQTIGAQLFLDLKKAGDDAEKMKVLINTAVELFEVKLKRIYRNTFLVLKSSLYAGIKALNAAFDVASYATIDLLEVINGKESQIAKAGDEIVAITEEIQNELIRFVGPVTKTIEYQYKLLMRKIKKEIIIPQRRFLESSCGIIGSENSPVNEIYGEVAHEKVVHEEKSEKEHKSENENENQHHEEEEEDEDSN